MYWYDIWDLKNLIISCHPAENWPLRKQKPQAGDVCWARVVQNMGCYWRFERMHKTRTLWPGFVSTTAPSSLDTRKPGAAAPLSWVVTGICWVSSLLFVGWGLSSPADLCSISSSNSHPGLCSSATPQPGENYLFSPQPSLMHFSPYSLCCLCSGWSAWQILT